MKRVEKLAEDSANDVADKWAHGYDDSTCARKLMREALAAMYRQALEDAAKLVERGINRTGVIAYPAEVGDVIRALADEEDPNAP